MSWAQWDYQVHSWSHWINHCIKTFAVQYFEFYLQNPSPLSVSKDAVSIQPLHYVRWGKACWRVAGPQCCQPSCLSQPSKQQQGAELSENMEHIPVNINLHQYFNAVLGLFQWSLFMAKLDSRLAVLLKLRAGNGSLSTSHLNI